MDIDHVKEPLKQFVQNIPQDIKVEELIIFGSYLEGCATEESDIDVAVVSDDFRNLDDDQRLGILYEAADTIEPTVHPWGFTNQELETAHKLSTLGYIRTSGIRFV